MTLVRAPAGIWMSSSAPCPLIERDQQLAHLTKLISEASGGRSAVATVSGQPGSGRTAFLAVAAALARANGLWVATAQGTAEGVLRPAERGPSAPEEPGTAGTRDAVALLAGTHATAAAVIVDDAQWVDPAMSARLAAATQRKREHGLLVLLAVHRSVLAGQPDYDADLWLPGLSEAGVLALLARRWPAPIRGGLVADAVALTRGNPAVLCDAFSRLAAAGGDTWTREEFAACASQAWNDLVSRVLDGLPAETVSLLGAIAMWGNETSLPLACELARLDISPLAAGKLLAASGLATPGSAGVRLEPPVAGCVLSAMPPKARSEVSERAIALGRAGNLPDAALASLLLRTRPSGQEWAFGTLYDSALQVRSDEPGLAARLLARALREPAPAQSLDRARLELATIQGSANPIAAGRGLRQVLTTGGTGLPGSLPGAADLLLCQDDTPHSRQAVAVAWARPDLAGPERAGLAGLFWLGAHHHHLRPPAGGPEVPSLAQEPDDPVQASVAAAALAVRGVDRDLACRLARRAIEAPSGLAWAGAERLLAPRILAATVLSCAGDQAEALGVLTAVASDARRRGAGPAAALALVTRADVLLGWGRPDQAAADLSRARPFLPRGGTCCRTLPLAAAIEIELNLDLGRLAAAERAAAAPLPDGCAGCSGWTRLLYARGLLALAGGKVPEARELLEEAGRRARASQWANPAFLMWRSAAALACHLLDRADEAEQLSSDEISAASRWGAARPLGLACLQAGWSARPALASEHFRQAVALLRLAGDRRGYIRAVLALAGAAGDQAGGAAEIPCLLREAATLADQPGLGSFRHQVTELSRRYGDPPELSSAQLKVAELAAAGTSSAAIAARLSISRRTVELHLTTVYRKLGIKGRPELADALSAGGGEQ